MGELGERLEAGVDLDAITEVTTEVFGGLRTS